MTLTSVDWYVVGYVGSFNVYEGLEDLIEAFAALRQRGVDAALLLLGSGEPRGFDSVTCEKTATYRALAAKLGVSEFVFMPGRVSAKQTTAYLRAAGCGGDPTPTICGV